MRDIVNTMADWAWETDADGAYTSVSGNYEQILGYTAEELLGRTPFDLMPEDEARRIRRAFEEHVAEKRPIEDLENWNVRKDGRRICLLTNGIPLLDDGGNLIGYRGVDRDITERTELRRQLEHAQRMQALGTLAGGIAHDFNNMLQVLLGHITLFQMEKRPSDRDWQTLKAMSNEIEHGSRLVRQLVAFSRGGEVDRGPLNINQVVERVAGTIRSGVGRRILVRTELPEDLWAIEGDSGRLEQVLVNLGVNARDAMPHEGLLVFRTEKLMLDDEYVRAYVNVEPGPYVLVTVSDTGVGMDEETAARAFEPFFTTKGVLKEEPVQALPTGTETVLVADDEPAVVAFVVDGLSAYGYTVLSAGNGREALQIFKDQHEQIDLVMLDLIMPEMDARDSLYHMLDIEPEAVVLMTSGRAPEGGEEALLREGARGFLEKPFSLIDLLLAVRRSLDEAKEGPADLDA
jgi:PAS domain S-box-containing protein